MDVGVDEEPDAAVGYLLDRRDDLVRERSELTVNEEDAVGSDECTNGSSLALERIEVVGELCGLNLDLAEIGLRGSSCRGTSGPTCAALPLRTRRHRHQCGRCQHRYRETEYRFRHGSRSLKPKAYTEQQLVVLGARCWVLGAGAWCWVLGAGAWCWVLGAGVLGARGRRLVLTAPSSKALSTSTQ